MLGMGKEFSAHSPLSRNEKEFLLQFEGGSKERVLNDECLNDEQLAASNDVKSGNGSRRNRPQQRLKNNWAQQLGVRLHRGSKGGWWNIAGGVSPKGTYGRSLPEGWPKSPPAWDHGSLWVRGTRILVAVSQPYPWMLIKNIEEVNGFAKTYGLSFKVSNFPSWHYPGFCWFFEWYSNQSPDDIMEHYNSH